MTETKLTKLIGFQAEPEMKIRLSRMAKANDRNVSQEIRRILERALEEFETDQEPSHIPTQPRY